MIWYLQVMFSNYWTVNFNFKTQKSLPVTFDFEAMELAWCDIDKIKCTYLHPFFLFPFQFIHFCVNCFTKMLMPVFILFVSTFPSFARDVKQGCRLCKHAFRSCAGVKEPGWPSKSLGVQKQTDGNSMLKRNVANYGWVVGNFQIRFPS